MGPNADEAFIERDEGHHMKDRVRVDVLDLQPIVEEHPLQEIVDGLREAANDGGGEHHLIRFGVRGCLPHR